MKQLTGRINGLRRVCLNASFQTKLKVANGVVMSKLTYLITLWGGAQQYLLSALQVQQMTAPRAGQCVGLVAGAGARRGCWTKLAGCLLDSLYSTILLFKPSRHSTQGSPWTCTRPSPVTTHTEPGMPQLGRLGKMRHSESQVSSTEPDRPTIKFQSRSEQGPLLL